MKLLISLVTLFITLSVCNLSERLSKLKGGSTDNQKVVTNSAPEESADNSGDDEVEEPQLTAVQREILNNGQQIDWENQGISFTVPKNWKKMSVKKEMINYASPDLGFLIGTIAVMPDNFPSDTSLKATFDSSLQQLKNGKYENARYLEIDGVKGVEFIESMPEDKGDPRRHQWIAFRNYQGQNQQLNIILSTKGNSFDKHAEDFPAVLYSMKIDK